ncbi:sirohydrochlorin chelatase [Marinicellulosiphila megalodicopiae]|uniref:sirohydrochlorin chelatase n=1 Tax=Marinicellulosiphila megalodicopiae TaxID=2724896 RepID=UPI003BB04DE8
MNQSTTTQPTMTQSTMNGLIWIAHGSKRVESNQAVADLVERVAPQLTNKFDLILPAFLELTDPKIEAQAEVLIKKGCKKITLFPYFLAPGHHLVSDLPKIQQQLQTRFVDCDVELIEHLAELKDWDAFLVNALQSD